MYLLYNVDTGEILSKIMCSLESIEADVTDTVNFLETSKNVAVGEMYCPDGVLCYRPEFNLKIGKTKIIPGESTQIYNIPDHTKVLINGLFYGVCNDSKITIIADNPGMCRVQLQNFPYKVKEIIYNVSKNSEQTQ